MKKFLFSIVAVVAFHFAMAQAPQGLNYQAVVYSTSGSPLSNQSVSLQLSVLDSSAVGTAVYVETHTATTDTTGLFSVVIGNGTVISGNFSSINWGKNYKFLKTEIDTLAGTNYVTMGVTQLMSVPYALYANQTKPTFASIDYPDGMSNPSTVFITSVPYTVPSGKNLYLEQGTFNFQPGLNINGHNLQTTTSRGTFGASENQIVSISNDTLPAWLVDKTVDWITEDIISNPITVPLGKTLVITFGFGSLGGHLMIDGNKVFINLNHPVNMVLKEGQVLSTNGMGTYFVNGYFRDN